MVYSDIFREVDPRVDIDIVDFVMSKYVNICMNKTEVINTIFKNDYRSYIYKNSIVIVCYTYRGIKIIWVFGDNDDIIYMLNNLSKNNLVYGNTNLIKHNFLEINSEFIINGN